MRRACLYLCILVWLAVLLFTGCQYSESKASVAMPIIRSHLAVPAFQAGVFKNLPQPVHRKEEVTVSFVGDIMVHYAQLRRAYDYKSGTFDFSGSFKYVKNTLQSADYAIGNLETTFGMPESSRVINEETGFAGYSGFPCFNTPESMADALALAGFDFMATANNHALDTGDAGMKNTLKVLDEKGIRHTGTFFGERAPFELVEVKGVTLAIVNYTYGTNGFTLESAGDLSINTLNMYSEENVEMLLEDVASAKLSGADAVIVFLHWGNEYQDQPEHYYQVPLGNAILDAGADVIIGSHPHVLQPIVIPADGTGDLIAYSLGNFLSSQTNLVLYGGAATDTGAILTLSFETVDGEYSGLKGYYLLPTVVTRRSDDVCVLPVSGNTAASEVLEKMVGTDIQADIAGSPFGAYFEVNNRSNDQEK